MIELTKTTKPRSLVEKADVWTKGLMEDYYRDGEIDPKKQNQYRKPDIKQAVKNETKEKCAYCESKITHIYPGDIEHIIPKSVYPRLTFTWSNLTFCCYRCNNRKRDFLDRSCMLLNPYKDKTNTHLRAFGPMLMHINSSKRGELTLRKLDLNQKEILNRRKEKIEELQLLVDKFNGESTTSLKNLIGEQITEFIQESEYTFTLQHYIEEYGVAGLNLSEI